MYLSQQTKTQILVEHWRAFKLC